MTISRNSDFLHIFPVRQHDRSAAFLVKGD